MTKKDYEQFAVMIHDFLEEYGYDQHNRRIAGLFVSRVIVIFQKDNPMFDEVRFRRACFDGA